MFSGSPFFFSVLLEDLLGVTGVLFFFSSVWMLMSSSKLLDQLLFRALMSIWVILLDLSSAFTESFLELVRLFLLALLFLSVLTLLLGM